LYGFWYSQAIRCTRDASDKEHFRPSDSVVEYSELVSGEGHAGTAPHSNSFAMWDLFRYQARVRIPVIKLKVCSRLLVSCLVHHRLGTHDCRQQAPATSYQPARLSTPGPSSAPFLINVGAFQDFRSRTANGVHRVGSERRTQQTRVESGEVISICQPLAARGIHPTDINVLRYILTI